MSNDEVVEKAVILWCPPANEHKIAQRNADELHLTTAVSLRNREKHLPAGSNQLLGVISVAITALRAHLQARTYAQWRLSDQRAFVQTSARACGSSGEIHCLYASGFLHAAIVASARKESSHELQRRKTCS